MRSDFVACASSTPYDVFHLRRALCRTRSLHELTFAIRMSPLDVRSLQSSSTSGSDVSTRRPMSPFRTPSLDVRCFHFRFPSFLWTATSTHELHHSLDCDFNFHLVPLMHPHQQLPILFHYSCIIALYICSSIFFVLNTYNCISCVI